MKGVRNSLFRSNYAVSEVVGGLLLLVIAVVAFAIIAPNLFPEGPDTNTPVKIIGDVTEEGYISLYHDGGSSLSSYEIIARYPNGTNIGSTTITDDDWNIGEYRYPLSLVNKSDLVLVNDSIEVTVSVYANEDDGSQDLVFFGTLKGKIEPPTSQDISGDSMLMSSLKTDTTEEDLICYSYTIDPVINPLTYIYNWIVDGNSINNVYYPFDTNSSVVVKDYSNNSLNAENNGSTWESFGKVGGAYQLDGDDDYISIPYCFDGSYVDELTVEAWVKTSSESGALFSFERDTLCELLVDEGVLRWFTYGNGETSDTIGTTNIADNTWHHIASTYDYLSGECAIYVDGILDKSKTGHESSTWLGSGSNPDGIIGITDSGPIPGSWETLTYDDFEDGFGNYTDGGRDCRLYTGTTYAHQGDNAANIQDNNGYYSSFYHTNSIDVDSPGYTHITVDFWFYADSMENWEDFYVRFWDGDNWEIVAEYDSGDEFENGQFYHEIVWINETEYNFPSNMKILFQCSASSEYDDIFIDEVYVNVSGGEKSVSNFSGIIDEFKIYNRALTNEQIYQNYLCTRFYGHTDRSVIVSDETTIGEIWSCIVTPNNSIIDDQNVESNSLQIVGYGGGS